MAAISNPYTHTHTHTHIYICSLEFIALYICVCIYIYMYKYIHVYTYIHVHTFFWVILVAYITCLSITNRFSQSREFQIKSTSTLSPNKTYQGHPPYRHHKQIALGGLEELIWLSELLLQICFIMCNPEGPENPKSNPMK